MGDKQVIVFTTKRAFKTRDAPSLHIRHSPHEYFVGGQSPNGEFLGVGPGKAPRAGVTRPSSKQIRYSFKPSELHLAKSYRWFGSSGGPGSEDKVPNKGSVTTKIG